MGKRELLLVALFAVLGVIVYRVSVPPEAPGERSFSISQLIGNIRREVRGNRASAERATTTTHPVGPGVTELRLDLQGADITITGEDRTTVEATFTVQSNGYDAAEAERLASESHLKLEDAGASIMGSTDYPEAGRQTSVVVLKVPSRLVVRLEPTVRELTISNVAGVELVNSRGETQITKVSGRVAATQRSSQLKISDVGSVRLTTVGADITLEHVRGESGLNVRGGEIRGADLIGPIELEASGSDIIFEKLGTTTGTIRINVVNGTLTLRGLRTDGRIDARDAEVAVEIDRAAPLAIYAQGNDDVVITAPTGGYRLDAAAQEGRVTLPEGSLEVTENGKEQRASGAVRGGGGTITVRSARGDIVVKDRPKAEG